MRKLSVLRSRGTYDSDKVSRETSVHEYSENLAVDSHKDECDINTIVRRFNVTGQLPQGVRVPSYQSFEGIWDYQTAMNAIRDAQESFMAMPSRTRERFGNDPARFVEFCSDPKNIDEMRKMGLAVPEKVVQNISGSSSGKPEGDDGSSTTGTGKGGKSAEEPKGSASAK